MPASFLSARQDALTGYKQTRADQVRGAQAGLRLRRG